MQSRPIPAIGTSHLCQRITECGCLIGIYGPHYSQPWCEPHLKAEYTPTLSFNSRVARGIDEACPVEIRADRGRKSISKFLCYEAVAFVTSKNPSRGLFQGLRQVTKISHLRRAGLALAARWRTACIDELSHFGS